MRKRHGSDIKEEPDLEEMEEENTADQQKCNFENKTRKISNQNSSISFNVGSHA